MEKSQKGNGNPVNCQEGEPIYIIRRHDGKCKTTEDIDEVNYYLRQGYTIKGIPKTMAHEQELMNKRDN